MIRSNTYMATPPGATIKEQLNDRGMTQKEFATRLGMSEKHISKLINGEVYLTSEMAIKLEMVLGIPAKFWNNLEAIYREKLLKAQLENEMEEDKKIAKIFPYSQLVRLGWIEKTQKIEEKVINLRKYFEVVNLSLITNNAINKIACRRIYETEKADYALLAWAQKAKLEARNQHTSKINISLLEKSIPTIRKMTREEPEDFCEKLIHLLSSCGIALVFLPHLKGSYLHGATFYDKNKIVIGMTVRGKDVDKFWFSLFHELGHIILGHINQYEGTSSQDENDADLFAQNTLISNEDFLQFVKNNEITNKSIISFSNAIDIDAGILVGRLQKENYIPFNRFNNLKKQYQITN